MNRNNDKNNTQSINLGHISIDVGAFGAEPNRQDTLVMPTRNLVMFPGTHLTIGLGREKSIAVAEFAEQHNVPIAIVCQVDPSVEQPELRQLYHHGVVADVLKVFELPDGQKTALVRGRQRCCIMGAGSGETRYGVPQLKGALSAKIRISYDQEAAPDDVEFNAIVQAVSELHGEINQKTHDELPISLAEGEQSPAELINTVATNTPLDVPVKIEMLKMRNIKDRALALLGALQRFNEMLDVRNSVLEKAREGMESNQRSAFLQQQLEAIRSELYGDDADDADRFALRLGELAVSEEVEKTMRKEIDKLRRLNPQSPDYSVQYQYLDTITSLPWNLASLPVNDIAAAQQILDNDHYGLEKVKERIIEQLALIMDNPAGKSRAILCLVGPPGVGKTSLGQSVARALGREYQRVALGGLHDEAEIRGHRRTYIGAMPGRIIDAVKRAGTSNPVILLDEIDKIGADYKGDPSSALLEVLDPEQNCHFHDNYVDIDFDLSEVLFIATANTLQTVPRPLLDRIEIIELPGYVADEKIEIGRRHLLPRIISQQNWEPGSVSVSPQAMAAIIEDYTAESGVRQFEKALQKIFRKAVLAHLRGDAFPEPVQPEHLKELLGTAPYHRDRADNRTPQPGVVTGLAWTAVGGETLLVEVSLSPAVSAPGQHGGGPRLTLTGNLGDVMRESATIALQWIKAHAADLGISADRLNANDIHVHFPEGAVPKDGPSAGITMVTAMVSALTGRAPRACLAMTGETTLRGRVLPVGGIREKLLAARRAGVTDIVLCSENRRDVDDIPANYLTGLSLHYVDTLQQVLDFALS